MLSLLFAAPLLFAGPRPEPTHFSESKIPARPYEQILGEWSKLEREKKDGVRQWVFGTSLRQRPLVLWELQALTARTSHIVVITANTHGTEYLGFEEHLPRLLTESKRVKKFREAGGSLLVVPVVNPDGFAARQRENARGVDLNRDWSFSPLVTPGLQQPETLALATTIDGILHRHAQARLMLAVDYHCCAGALLHAAGDPRPRLSQEVARLAHAELAVALGSTKEILGYEPQGTCKDYFAKRYQAAAFTYEGRAHLESSQLPAHVRWWEHTLAALQRPYFATAPSFPQASPFPAAFSD